MGNVVSFVRRPAESVTDSAKGFILLQRRIQTLPFYKDSAAVHLWLHLMLSANHAPSTVNTHKGDIAVGRGQLITGSLTLAKETGIDVQKVKNVLRKLRKLGVISSASHARFSVITLENYDEICAENKQNSYPQVDPNFTPTKPDVARPGAEVLPEVDPNFTPNNNILNTNTLNTNVFNDRCVVKNCSVVTEKKSPTENHAKKPPHPLAAVSSRAGSKWGTQADLDTAESIFSLIRDVNPAKPRPNMTAWANDIRLLRQSRQISHEEIFKTFQWANADSFWYSNILSPKKLRDKWDTLSLQRHKANRKKRVDDEPIAHWNSWESWEKEFLWLEEGGDFL